MAEHSGRPRFQEEIREVLAALRPARKEVTFVLGTDEYIHHERRAGLVPRHVAALGETLRSAGLVPDVRVVEGTGDRAGFSDQDYVHAGGRIVRPGDVSALRGVDVLHALKEPTEYESEVPGPFLRIGALHLASYPPGVCKMLRTKNAVAIFDGGTVGSCSHLLDDGDRTPIVASMSRFAGSVSGQKLVEGLRQNGVEAGKIVVVGGGIAGLAAIDKIGPKLETLVVVEPYPPTQERLPKLLGERDIRDYEIVPKVTDDVLDGAVGVIFAHRSGANAAAKVCNIDQIRRMKKGAAVVDIAIDQGGSILHDGYSEDDDAATSRDKYRALLTDFFYYAETNMPREVPREASETHGDAVWVYVAALLGLTALHGGVHETAREILRHDVRSFSKDDLGERGLLECLVQDLRNGLQLVTEGGVRITDPEIAKDEKLVQWVEGCSRG